LPNAERQAGCPRLTPKQIEVRLAAIARDVAAGSTVAEACLANHVSVPSYYRWLSGGRTVRTAAPEAVRETILRAARTAFLRDGFGAGLERVAAVAGVSRQTVYNLFGTKERLFGEVVQSVYRRMIAPALVVDRGADLPTMLAICGRHLLALMLDPEAVGLMRIALGEYREHPQLAAFAYAVRTSPIVPNVTEVIGRRLEAEMAAGAIAGCTRSWKPQSAT
jgi:AcrR family transcriptional regulator